MKVWKVRYIDVDTMLARRPFWKHTAYVEAESRKAAIEKVSLRWREPKYQVKSASVAEGKQADLFY